MNIVEQIEQPAHTTGIQDAEISKHVGSETCKTCETSPLTDLPSRKWQRLPRPVVRVTPGQIPTIVAHAEAGLAQSRRCYQRGGVLVTVITDPLTFDASVKILPLPSLIQVLAEVLDWEKFDKRSDEWEPCDPPERYCRILHDALEYPHIPVLAGIARQPYLRADGSLVAHAGYDEATGLFGAFLENQYRIISHPSRMDAQEALAAFSGLLSEFRFQAPYDFAAALSGILTATIRATLPLAPMFHVRAPQFGTGKTYLAELFIAFASAQFSAPLPFPSSNEELRKVILTELMLASAAIFFDNISTDLLPYNSLCAALTSRFISGRILGLSKISRPSTQALFISTGVNVGPVQDMGRRTVTIHMDAGEERPETRTYKHDPVEEVHRNREVWIAQALTIVHAWIVAGRPKTVCPAVAGYSEWDDLCRQPLLWLGLPDPASSMFSKAVFDPDRDALRQLLLHWHATFGQAPKLLREILIAIENPRFGDLREAIEDVAGERAAVNRRQLGRYLLKNEGRILDGLRLIRFSDSRGAVAWSVQQVLQVSPSPPSEFVTA